MTALIVIIYLAFIGLGLPDSLLGSAWPTMRLTLGASVGAAGVISMIVSGGTILSSLCSARLVHRFGTRRVTIFSVALTAAALFGYAAVPNVLWLGAMAVPMGLGAGSVDAALNNFVALHYDARHMSWLHCGWGIGATLGPVILSQFLARERGWSVGIRTIALLQTALVVVLVLSRPLWRKVQQAADAAKETPVLSNRQALALPGIGYALVIFFGYCAAELSCGLWAGSWLVEYKGIAAGTAAAWVSLYYGGITLGRALSGFVMTRISGNGMIRLGLIGAVCGTLLLALPLPPVASMAALGLIGLGCAPVYPCMIHETPARFGMQNSQAAMGLQMACAYVGSTFMPPVMGLLAEYVSIRLFPAFLLVFFLISLGASEQLRRKVKTQPSL